MDITTFALSKKTITLVLLVLILLSGLYSYFTLPQSEDPGFTVRTAQVITVYPGASPERVRDTVTIPLEDAIGELGELDVMTSSSREGVSIITVNIAFENKDLQAVWKKLSDAVDSVRDDLPDGVESPRVEDDYGDVFSILLAVTGEGYSAGEMKDVAEDVRRELMGISEVSRVNLYGLPDEEVLVSYDRHRLQSLGLTPYSLAGAIQKTNVIKPAGSLRIGIEDITLESSGNFTSLEYLEETLIPLPGAGEVVPLRDIADISVQTEDPLRTIVRQNGETAVALAINMKEGGRITVMGDQVREVVDRLSAQYPVGIDFSYMIFQPELVSGLISQFTFNVIQSVIVVMLVMILAAGLRSGMVVASLVPSTMIGSLFIMNLAGIGINQMSLASLIIVLGMLVDSGIVIIETIQLDIDNGKKPFEAAVDASRELRIPLLTSALTTSASFLPIAMAQNPAGEYTRPLFFVVTIALLLAWVFTITLIPFLAVRFLPAGRKKKLEKDSGFFYKGRIWYVKRLSIFLKRRVLMVGLLFLGLIGSLFLFRQIPVSFFPTTVYPYFTMEISLPRGTSISETSAVASKFDSYMVTELEGDISTHGTFIGGGVPRFRLNIAPQDSRPEFAFFLAEVRDEKNMENIFEKLRLFAAETSPDAEVKLSRFTYGPGFNSPVEIRLSGKDRDQLYALVNRVKDDLLEKEGILNVKDDWGLKRKTLNVDVMESSARQFGITNQDVAVSLQAASVGLPVSRYRGGDREIPILLKDGSGDQTSVEELQALAVYSEATGKSVPLSQVAQINLQWQPSMIMQRDGRETITIQADVYPGINPISIAREMEALLKDQSAGWPSGYGYEMGGTSEGSQDANKAIIKQVPIALFIIIMLLVLQFNSIRKSLIILITIPFGFIGVVFGLWVTGSSFSFMSLLGLVSLSGVVVNDAIILLEKIDLEIMGAGTAPLLAIYRAANRKFRPIILTSVTTIMGLVPLLIFGGPLWLPMASALIFGLAFATILTLGLIPALYSILYRIPSDEKTPSINEVLS